jgi:hypothetical protein
MQVWVLSKVDSYDRLEILGVFSTVEVAKTIGEAEEPDRIFEWESSFEGNNWTAASRMKPGPVYAYDIEEFEVREK